MYVQCISNTRPNIWEWILTLKKEDIWNHTIRDEKIEKTRKTHTIWTRWDENRYVWTLIHSTAYYETTQLSLGSALHFSARSQNCEWRLLASSCPSAFLMSVRMKQLGSHWTDYHEILYLRTSPIFVEKIQVSFKIWQEWRVLYTKTNMRWW